jgi:hypothetical protein
LSNSSDQTSCQSAACVQPPASAASSFKVRTVNLMFMLLLGTMCADFADGGGEEQV